MSELVKGYFLVLKNYSLFAGRARRPEFWLFTLVHIGIYIVLWIILFGVSQFSFGSFDFINSIPGWVIFAYFLLTLMPVLGVSFRRLHDIGHTGWWLLIGLVPVVGPFMLLYFFLQDSVEDNDFGDNPLFVPPIPVPDDNGEPTVIAL
jgi:uncharacterized membrane protein YhaH (DUF805 family)